MNLRSRVWGIGAGIFAIVNALGAGLAGAMGERVHTDVHLVLLLASALVYVAWRTLTRGRRGASASSPADPQIEYLQQSVDALALEVERLGEAQRAREKLQSERVQPPPPKRDQ